MNKVLILTYTGFQEHEVIYPYYRMLGAGYIVDIIADKRDANNSVYGSFGVSMPCNILIKDFIADLDFYLKSYDLLVIPGGMNSIQNLRQIKPLLNFIQSWNSIGKPIATICDGTHLLIDARIISDRHVGEDCRVKDAGVTSMNDEVVVDGNIFSTRHYNDMGKWMETVITSLTRSQRCDLDGIHPEH